MKLSSLVTAMKIMPLGSMLPVNQRGVITNPGELIFPTLGHTYTKTKLDAARMHHAAGAVVNPVTQGIDFADTIERKKT